MKKFEKPTLKFSMFNLENVVTSASGLEPSDTTLNQATTELNAAGVAAADVFEFVL